MVPPLVNILSWGSSRGARRRELDLERSFRSTFLSRRWAFLVPLLSMLSLWQRSCYTTSFHLISHLGRRYIGLLVLLVSRHSEWVEECDLVVGLVDCQDVPSRRCASSQEEGPVVPGRSRGSWRGNTAQSGLLFVANYLTLYQ